MSNAIFKILTSKKLGTFNNEESFKKYFNTIKKIPLLTREQERDLVQKAQNGCDASFKKVIESNLRLVVKIAKYYNVTHSLGDSFFDLVQEGNIGLMKSIKSFDLSKDFRLSTYSSWYIRKYILMYFEANYHCIKFPGYIISLSKTLSKDVIPALQKKLKREPYLREIIDFTQQNPKHIKFALMLQHFQKNVESNKSYEQTDKIYDCDDERPLIVNFSSLMPKEEMTIRLKYGISR